MSESESNDKAWLASLMMWRKNGLFLAAVELNCKERWEMEIATRVRLQLYWKDCSRKIGTKEDYAVLSTREESDIALLIPVSKPCIKDYCKLS